MAFHEVRFPEDISYGSSGGPGFMTQILEQDSGHEQRIGRWSSERRTYDASHGLKSAENLAELLSFYLAVGSGGQDGFRFKDWSDFSTASDHKGAPAFDDVVIGAGDATETVFQLQKVYTVGALTRTRILKKPVSGTVKVGLGGTEQGSGWTVNTATGEITFSSPPGNGVEVTAGCEFDVPVRFGKEADRALSILYEAYEAESLPNIPLIEIKDEAEYPGNFFYGGAAYIVLNADYQIAANEARVIRVDPDAASRKLKLPATTNLPHGGPYYYIENVDGTYGVELRDDSDTLLTTVAAGGVVIVLLALTSGGAKDWLVI